MRRIVIVIVLILLLTITVGASEFNPPEVHQEAAELMPDEATSFAEGLWYIFSESLEISSSTFFFIIMLSPVPDRIPTLFQYFIPFITSDSISPSFFAISAVVASLPEVARNITYI